MLKIFNITDDFSLLSVAAQKEIKRADKVFLQSEQVACLQDVRALNPSTEVLDRFFEQSADERLDKKQLGKESKREIEAYQL